MSQVFEAGSPVDSTPAISPVSPLPVGQRLEATALDSSSDLLALVVDELAHGMLVIDRQRWILQANASALREFQRGMGLHNQHGRLTVSDAAQHGVLDAAIEKAASGERSLIGLVHGATTISIAVVPLRTGRADRVCEHIALFFSRPEVHESGVFAAFAHSQRLTRTEQHVLGFLCRCLSTPEIAVEMGVAVSTVRSHVRSLCAKTQSSGVRELVNRVVVLPPLAPTPAQPQVRLSPPGGRVSASDLNTWQIH